MQIPKAIFFDNDGILVDTEPLYFEANRTVMKEAGFELTLEKHVEHNMKNGLSVFDFLEQNGTQNIPALIKQRNAIYLELIKTKLYTFPEAELVLQFLVSQNIKIGVVTSSRRAMFQAIHNQTGFHQYFDFIIDREDVTNSKPNPEPYLKALKTAQVTPDEALVVEDSERGLRSARAANIECLTIPTPLTKDQDFSAAKKVLKNISEIREILS